MAENVAISRNNRPSEICACQTELQDRGLVVFVFFALVIINSHVNRKFELVMRSHLSVPLLASLCFLTGCMSMPLTTMYKLSHLDPMQADPAQLKVAIRADERIAIPEGGANINFKFNAEDGQLNFDETFVIEIIRNPIMSINLVKDKKPGESVTVLQLSEHDAQRFRNLQALLEPYVSGNRKGSASFGVGIAGVCLHSPMPADEVLLDIFLQTSEHDGYYVFLKDLDVRELSDDEDADLPEWSICDQSQVG